MIKNKKYLVKTIQEFPYAFYQTLKFYFNELNKNKRKKKFIYRKKEFFLYRNKKTIPIIDTPYQYMCFESYTQQCDTSTI